LSYVLDMLWRRENDDTMVRTRTIVKSRFDDPVASLPIKISNKLRMMTLDRPPSNVKTVIFLFASRCKKIVAPKHHS